MATKSIAVEGIGLVTFVKSTRNRSIRLTVRDGTVRVSLPYWTPYAIANAFVLQHMPWVKAELAKRQVALFEDGQKIGKRHNLSLMSVPTTDAATSRVTALRIIVKYHPEENPSDATVQTRVKKAVLRALKKEAEQLLPPRLDVLARTHGFTYQGFAVKQLKRRWGSCDSHKNLVFNLYLMQTPWECIDYVLCHELTHTEHMNHGALFWERLTSASPRARDLRRQLNTFRPMIGG